jgi:hypothetical protein
MLTIFYADEPDEKQKPDCSRPINTLFQMIDLWAEYTSDPIPAIRHKAELAAQLKQITRYIEV